MVTALGDTLTSLLGGIQKIGAAAALPTIEGWERRLVSLGNPEFAPVAQVLTELKTQLSVDGTDPPRSMAFATDDTYPESDHAPVIAHFEVLR